LWCSAHVESIAQTRTHLRGARPVSQRGANRRRGRQLTACSIHLVPKLELGRELETRDRVIHLGRQPVIMDAVDGQSLDIVCAPFSGRACPPCT
jgi:hypothetical protein